MMRYSIYSLLGYCGEYGSEEEALWRMVGACRILRGGIDSVGNSEDRNLFFPWHGLSNFRCTDLSSFTGRAPGSRLPTSPTRSAAFLISEVANITFRPQHVFLHGSNDRRLKLTSWQHAQTFLPCTLTNMLLQRASLALHVRIRWERLLF